jgi:predicted site-specific integrase-resolvase
MGQGADVTVDIGRRRAILLLMAPVDCISLTDAAEILGCSRATVRRHILAGRLESGDRDEPGSMSRDAVEQLARRSYDWRKRLHDDQSYWLTGQRAADVLGVNRARLNQLADRGFVPYVTHDDGTRLYRREQLEVVANARQARWR